MAPNATADAGEISATVLAVDVVDDQRCLTEILRAGDRPDLRPATAPALRLATQRGGPLLPLDARGMPRGRLAWLWWAFKRPVFVPARLEASIPSIAFQHRAAPLSHADIDGPWRFSPLVPLASPLHAEGRWGLRGASH